MGTKKDFFEVKIPKILCLGLVISKYAKRQKYFNTNDLIKIANQKKAELVRLRDDKEENEYKYFKDTNFGGLRGNFSTLLTLCGLINKNNRITGYYSIGPGERLINAFDKGDIILDKAEFKAFTKRLDLKKLLEQESNYLTIRETQAHIKAFLKNNSTFPLKRDHDNYPKECVLLSRNNQYFFRILFNRYVESNVIEYNLLSYLQGSKIKKQNMHVLFVVPSEDNAWDEFYVIDSRDLLKFAPLFIYFDTKTKKVFDSNGRKYSCEKLSDGLMHLSDENGNAAERMSYNWKAISNSLVGVSLSTKGKGSRTESEESEFIKNFLHGNLNNKLEIMGKKVREYLIHRAGVDVTISFEDGSNQPMELEHQWHHYIAHGHQNNIAWKDAWIFANEAFDFDLIKRIFASYKGLYIPSIFICFDPKTKTNHAYKVDWTSERYIELPIKF